MRLVARVLLPILLSGCASSAEPATVSDAAPDASPDAAASEAPADALDVDASGDTTPDAIDAACTLAKPYSSKDADCNACAEAKCCAEVNGCLADPRCDDDYVNCILACALLPPDAGGAGDGGDAGVAACVADCGAAHPQGKAAYDAAIGCVDARCEAACK